MAKLKNGLPRTWVTWITGLLSGEEHCEFKGWFKSRYTYDKLDDSLDPEWMATHSAMVHKRASELRDEDFTVRVEHQNNFVKKGQTAILAGKPDIIAKKPGEILISDEKSGKRKDAHWWQVAIYLGFIRNTLGVDELPTGTDVMGELIYREGAPVYIALSDVTTEKKNLIIQRMLTIGLAFSPAKTPSESECRFCNISKADCPERMTDPDTVIIETNDF